MNNKWGGGMVKKISILIGGWLGQAYWGGGSPYQSNFDATKDTEQNFQLENGCL